MLLDIEKMFDRVWLESLLYKLIQSEFPMYLIKLVSSYLNDRQFSVKLGKSISNSYPCRVGVPQGSLLSPLLFSIYMSDIPSSSCVKIAQYADDTAVYSSSRSIPLLLKHLQSYLDVLEKWFV